MMMMEKSEHQYNVSTRHRKYIMMMEACFVNRFSSLSASRSASRSGL